MERAGLPGHGVSAPAWRRSVTVGLSAPAEMDPAHLTLSVATGTHHSLTYSAPTEKTQGAEPGRRDRMRTGEGRLGQPESRPSPAQGRIGSFQSVCFVPAIFPRALHCPYGFD
ncbi:hypothetical protein IscW_ISCW015897 [Ixodes scapularis]|uniref:Uncharacterized protein n=1 Tax=Ixodes scapularis TaxID=6945 RepID=B7P4K9_IXOSC|nr:hypothetical protein IscW_ISCW015897 [Ixodes scapularis]|eukprot:XP_002406202.1 hypothetical protein IscW_ISCW015897 [Ixodes scapularis]